MGKFLSFKYYFLLRPNQINTKLLIGLLIFLGVILLLGIALQIIGKKKDPLIKRALNKYSTLCLTFSVVSYIFLFFRYELVYIFSARFFPILWTIACLVWLGYIIKFHFKKIPMIKKQHEEREKFEKYLPKKK